MAHRPIPSVKPSREVRDDFGELLRAFRAKGEDADPVVFGAQRRPEAVLMSYERYEAIQRGMDDVVIAAEVQERDRSDTGERMSFEQVVKGLGFDSKEFEED